MLYRSFLLFPLDFVPKIELKNHLGLYGTLLENIYQYMQHQPTVIKKIILCQDEDTVPTIWVIKKTPTFMKQFITLNESIWRIGQKFRKHLNWLSQDCRIEIWNTVNTALGPFQRWTPFVSRCHHPINQHNDKDLVGQRGDVFTKVKDYSKKCCL